MNNMHKPHSGFDKFFYTKAMKNTHHKRVMFVKLFLCTLVWQANSQIYTFRPELFNQDKVSTEQQAYELICQNPIHEQINYVAYPWAVLINQNLLNTVPNLKIENGYTVCQHIRYEKIIPILKQMGVKVLFTPHVDKDYEGITVLPFPHLAINGLNPTNTIKNIWASFVGAEYTHFTRAQIFKLFANDERFVLINRGKTWHFYLKEEQLAQNTHEYQDILVRSRFALCPRGTGASTIRFWESLQAGAIPVLISDSMRLPDYFDWDKCIVRVKETDVHLIPEILSKIGFKQELEMRKVCLLAYQNFANYNLISPIIAYQKNN